MEDPYRLERFVTAQDADSTLTRALGELRAGRKRTHWMWFVFPQVAGLGSSGTSRRYAVSSLEEARAYLAHPVLRSRLLEACGAVLDSGAPDASALLGALDAEKLRSSMTLFARAEPGEALFRAVLERYFGGVTDEATEERLT